MMNNGNTVRKTLAWVLQQRLVDKEQTLQQTLIH